MIEAFQGEIISTPREYQFLLTNIIIWVISTPNSKFLNEARFTLCGGLQPRKKSGAVLIWKIPLLNLEYPGQLDHNNSPNEQNCNKTAKTIQFGVAVNREKNLDEQTTCMETTLMQSF